MRRMTTRAVWTTAVLVACLLTTRTQSQPPPLREAHPRDDFTVREEMVPMRDGVKLYTLILTPTHASGPLPVLLERTPYDASRALGTSTTRLSVTLGAKDLGGGFVLAVQDLRGRFRSEGDYAMYRVPRGQFNSSQTDETTDAWDTVDWLVKNVPANNGKVGVWGRRTPAGSRWRPCASRTPRWRPPCRSTPSSTSGRQTTGSTGARSARPTRSISSTRWRRARGRSRRTRTRHATCSAGSSRRGTRRPSATCSTGAHEMWARLMEFPAYGPYWRDCAADRWFEAPARIVPTLHVHGLWDQEDIYGSPAAYAALEKHDCGNDRNYFAAGPWYHGQHFADGNSLGAVRFDEDTARRFRQDVLVPFLRKFLRGEDGPALSPVTVFETGMNRWRRFDQWPPSGREAGTVPRPGRDAGVGGAVGDRVVHRVRVRPREAGAQRAAPALGLQLRGRRNPSPRGVAGSSRTSGSWTGGPTWRRG